MAVYAIEADPGKLTASHPVFDNLDDALAAANVPAMVREGLPLPRVLTRRGGRWYVVCAAPTWHGPCILLKDHDPHTAYHRGAGPARCACCGGSMADARPPYCQECHDGGCP